MMNIQIPPPIFFTGPITTTPDASAPTITETPPQFFCQVCSIKQVSAQGAACGDCQADATAAATITTAAPAPTGRSYTKRAEIDGKIIFVTLHPDKIELSARYGRQTAEWSFEKLWQAAEGKLL